MTGISLAFTDITLSRGATSIVSGLSLSVASGDLLWVSGANGIGKSSLLRLAAGLLRPDSGDVSWKNGDAPVSAADVVSYQAHLDALKSSLTVFENLALWASPLGRKAQITPLLEKLGLTGFETRKAGTLSAGQSRRVMLAKLLIEDKPVWILDEPTAAIDSVGSSLIDALITAHIDDGGAVIMASHAAPKALSGRARVLTLSGGQS